MLDATGQMPVKAVTGSHKYSHIAAGTVTTVVSGGPCILHGITINTKGASSNTLTVYDNTAGSGTVVAVIDTTSAVVPLRFDIALTKGLTLVSATGTGADVTVSYL